MREKERKKERKKKKIVFLSFFFLHTANFNDLQKTSKEKNFFDILRVISKQISGGKGYKIFILFCLEKKSDARNFNEVRNNIAER